MHWPRWAEACCGCDEASCGARNPDPSTRSCLSRAAAFKRQARAQPGVEMRNVEFLRHQRSRAVAVGSQSPLVISQAMASSSITWATNSTALARSKTGLASVSGAKSQTSSHPDCRATGRPMTKHRSTGFRRKTWPPRRAGTGPAGFRMTFFRVESCQCVARFEERGGTSQGQCPCVTRPAARSRFRNLSKLAERA